MTVGFVDGIAVGDTVGVAVGIGVGDAVGVAEGTAVGDADGADFVQTNFGIGAIPAKLASPVRTDIN